MQNLKLLPASERGLRMTDCARIADCRKMRLERIACFRITVAPGKTCIGPARSPGCSCHCQPEPPGQQHMGTSASFISTGGCPGGPP
eukprot:3443100-Alexandrium_andersonii.AAC.1